MCSIYGIVYYKECSRKVLEEKMTKMHIRTKIQCDSEIYLHQIQYKEVENYGL